MEEDVQANSGWFLFAGVIDQNVVRNFYGVILSEIAKGCTQVHLGLHSTGGVFSDGVAIFSFLNTLPVDVIAYNTGYVASAGAIAYLGAKTRVVNRHATFMLHQATAAAGYIATGSRLQATVDSLHIDDARIRAIVSERAALTEAQSLAFSSVDLTLTAAQSIEAGIAHSIRDFRPTRLPIQIL